MLGVVEDERTVTLPEARLLRVTEVIALATAEAFDEAMSRLEVTAADELGLIEEALRIFLVELRDAKLRTERAVHDLTVTKVELEQKLATIERQEAALWELSVPILELGEGILSLPVIGALDAARALDMTERLLQRALTSQASWVLVDLTGVTDVNESTADHLLRLARTVRLLGCRCILTGIGPQIAQALVSLRADLQDLHPVASLREGLRYCLDMEQASGLR
jgi:rsbT co-antagonist protein RsbR